MREPGLRVRSRVGLSGSLEDVFLRRRGSSPSRSLSLDELDEAFLRRRGSRMLDMSSPQRERQGLVLPGLVVEFGSL